MRKPFRKRTFLWILCVFASVAFLQGGWSFYSLCRAETERAESGPSLPSLQDHEAIVVLTGDRGRISKALELLRVRGSPLALISGAGKGTRLKDVVNQQGDAVVKIHESWNRILIESESSSTMQNAEATAKLLLPRGVTRVILVTSDYHMPRARQIFARMLPSVEIVQYPVPSDFSNLSTRGLWYFAMEYLKCINFRLINSWRI